jgi:serpin B
MASLNTPIAATLPASESRIVSAMNGFTADLYDQLNRSDTSLILSPFNAAAALSMALAGAGGQTAEQIRSVLHVPNDPDYNASLGALLAGLTNKSNTGDNQLLMANGLWVQKGFAVEPAFERTIADNYRAPLSPVDFMSDAEAARSRINGWTEEQTKGRIKNLFTPGTLDAQTRLVLTSAIYFHGLWQAPFETSKTQPAPFRLPASVTTQADFMNQTSEFGYAETPSAQILEMRYAGTGFAFGILLPKSVTGLADLEKSLTKDTLTGLVKNLSTREVQVSLPKFRAESEFSLSATLSTMGMPMAFTDKADFSGISSKHGLMISQVIHKAFADVSEKGTEAAAATGSR